MTFSKVHEVKVPSATVFINHTVSIVKEKIDN